MRKKIKHAKSPMNNTKNKTSEEKRIEFLIVNPGSDHYVDSIDSYLSMLALDNRIKFIKDEDLLIYTTSKEEVKLQAKVDTGLTVQNEDRYFYIILYWTGTQKFHIVTEFYNLIIDISNRLGPSVSVTLLWNSISKSYAETGYSIVNDVENLLRRFIAKFMIINAGYDWVERHLPSGVKERDKADNNPDEDYEVSNTAQYLHRIYFSDLQKILFDGQREIGFRNIGDIQKIVEEKISKKQKTLNVEDMQGVVQKSLWEKYFFKIADESNKSSLKDSLEALNKERNKIAHNLFISREELGKIESISAKITKTLNLAFDELSSVVVTESDREIIKVENAKLYSTEKYHLSRVMQRFNSIYGDCNLQIAMHVDFLGKSSTFGTIGVEFKSQYRHPRTTKVLARQIAVANELYKLDKFVLFVPYVDHGNLNDELIIEALYNYGVPGDLSIDVRELTID